MYRRLLPTIILIAGIASAEISVPLSPEEADTAYKNIYRIAERHQAKSILLLIKFKLLCRESKKQKPRCKKTLNEVHELLMRLNSQLGDRQPNVHTLRKHYCELPNSEIEDTQEHKRCNRLVRLQNNLELSPQEQLNKVLKIEEEPDSDDL